MTFFRRQIDLEFKLGKNIATGTTRAFEASSGSDTIRFQGLKVRTKINKAGGPSMGHAQIMVFGMSRSIMNQLSTLGTFPNIIGPNYVTILAGADGGGKAVVFRGTIQAAWIDYSGAPDVSFHVEALAGLYESVQTAPVASYTGSTSATVMLSSLASLMVLAFENNGVSSKLTSPYYYGAPRVQAYDIARAANIEIAIDDFKLAIWPKGKARNGAVPLISPATGMVGYPSYTSTGISVLSLYNPSVSFGGSIKVESVVPNANGVWNVFTLDHELDAITPNGAWFTRIDCMRPNNLEA